MIYLETPLTVDKIKQLKAGDEVFLSGTIYTGRDAAHKRLIQLLDEGKELPFRENVPEEWKQDPSYLKKRQEYWPNTFKTRSSIWQWWTNHFRKNGCLFT